MAEKCKSFSLSVTQPVPAVWQGFFKPWTLTMQSLASSVSLASSARTAIVRNTARQAYSEWDVR